MYNYNMEKVAVVFNNLSGVSTDNKYDPRFQAGGQQSQQINPDTSGGKFDYSKFMSQGGAVKNFQDYINQIGIKESNNNYNAQGQMLQFGIHKGTRALGKYQFMPTTLRGLGINVSNDEFLRNTKLQEFAMMKFTMQNAQQLNINLSQATPQQWAALSMAHYGGIGSARKFLSNPNDPSLYRTQYGTGSAMPSIMQYSGYNKRASFEGDDILNGFKPLSMDHMQVFPILMAELRRTFPTIEDFNKLSKAEKSLYVQKYKDEVLGKNNFSLKSAGSFNLWPPAMAIYTQLATKDKKLRKRLTAISAIPAATLILQGGIINYQNKQLATSGTDEQIINRITEVYLNKE